MSVRICSYILYLSSLSSLVYDQYISSYQIRTRLSLGGDKFPKKPVDEAKVAAAKEALSKGINQIADLFLKDQPFICGDEISAADLIGVNEIIHMSGVNENELYEKNATISAWIKRVAARMAPHFDEALMKLKMINAMFNEGTPVGDEKPEARLAYYYDNLSQPCRAVYLFLKGTGVDFEPKPLQLIKGMLLHVCCLHDQ